MEATRSVTVMHRRHLYRFGCIFIFGALVTLLVYLLGAWPFSWLFIYDSFSACDLRLTADTTELAVGDRIVLTIQITAGRRSRIRLCKDLAHSVYFGIRDVSRESGGQDIWLRSYKPGQCMEYTTVILNKGETVRVCVGGTIERGDTSDSVKIDLGRFGVAETRCPASVVIWAHLYPIKTSLSDSLEDSTNPIEIRIITGP